MTLLSGFTEWPFPGKLLQLLHVYYKKKEEMGN